MRVIAVPGALGGVRGGPPGPPWFTFMRTGQALPYSPSEMGLSSKPKARARQLEALARGRETQARRLLESTAPAKPGPAPAEPGPEAPAEPGHSPGEVLDYGAPAPKKEPNERAADSPRDAGAGDDAGESEPGPSPGDQQGRSAGTGGGPLSRLAAGIREGLAAG